MRSQLVSAYLGVFCALCPLSVWAEVNEIAVTGSAVTYVKSTYATIVISISSLSKKATEATQNTAETMPVIMPLMLSELALVCPGTSVIPIASTIRVKQPVLN